MAQEVPSGSPRSPLRLREPTGPAKTAVPSSKNVLPPTLDAKKTSSVNEPTPLPKDSFIVAPKETRATLSLGGIAPFTLGQEESHADLASDHSPDEIELVSPLALRIATATMSHASPFFWFMAGTNNGKQSDSADLPVEPIAEASPEANQEVASEVTEEVAEEMADSVALEREPMTGRSAEPLPNLAEKNFVLEASEPPRRTSQDEPVLELSPADASTGEEEQVLLDEPEKMAAQPTQRKPAPRPIRIPFDKDADEGKSNESKSAAEKQGTAPKKDSQRDQEEPDLDPRNNRGEKEQQGVDALKASKPISDRREIRIEDPTPEGIQIAPIVQTKPADPVLANRLLRTEACLAFYLKNPESTSVRSPWAVMHALLAFGGDYEMVHGQGRVNAIGWMCHNGTCRTQRMFTPSTVGFRPNVGDGVQGHEGQFLAILAQSNVPLNYPIQIGAAKYTVEDLVRYEMATCKEKSELTFKLIGLSYYLDSNKQWRANDGKMWSISKLIQEELAQPIVGAACGGVHRLMGFSFSVRQRQMQGLQVNGQYARAAKFVKEYIDYTWQLQNPDGSFSTNWYEGRANEPNEERKVQTTGHMLEWLMYTLSDDEIKNPRVGKSIDFLLSKIHDKHEHKWPIGPRGHATRAIALYHARTKENLGQPSPSVPVNAAIKTGVTPIRK